MTAALVTTSMSTFAMPVQMDVNTVTLIPYAQDAPMVISSPMLTHVRNARIIVNSVQMISVQDVWLDYSLKMESVC